MILTDEEIQRAQVDTFGYTQFARAIEAAVIAKLVHGVEMPEPAVGWDFDHNTGYCRYEAPVPRYVENQYYTADQLRTVAAAALARLSELNAQKPCASMPRCALNGAEDCTCGVNGPCEGLTDVYLAAGASPQPSQAVELSDTKLLDWLQSKGENWTCRASETGRGWRLHQSSTSERNGVASVRGAIIAAINAKGAV